MTPSPPWRWGFHLGGLIVTPPIKGLLTNPAGLGFYKLIAVKSHEVKQPAPRRGEVYLVIRCLRAELILALYGGRINHEEFMKLYKTSNVQA